MSFGRWEMEECLSSPVRSYSKIGFFLLKDDLNDSPYTSLIFSSAENAYIGTQTIFSDNQHNRSRN